MTIKRPIVGPTLTEVEGIASDLEKATRKINDADATRRRPSWHCRYMQVGANGDPLKEITRDEALESSRLHSVRCPPSTARLGLRKRLMH